MIPGSVNFGISRGLHKGIVAALLIKAPTEDSTGLDANSQEVSLFNRDQARKLFSKEALPHFNLERQVRISQVKLGKKIIQGRTRALVAM